jgi:hypothetical protein
MDWQLLIVGVLVCVALAYLGRRTLRAWRGKGSGCGGGCKCPGTAQTSNATGTAHTLIPVEQITLRRR